jgi:hypothetical protein
MDGQSYAWTKVDRARWPKNLAPDDVCFYYYEYTPRRGKWFSQANMVVRDYKASRYEMQRDPGLRARKDSAINFYASVLGGFFETKRLKKNGTALSDLGQRIGLVPVPPSALPGSVDYDDRNVRTCELLRDRYGFKVCQDVQTVHYVGPSHMSSEPRTTERSYASLGLIESDARSCEFVFVIDDVIASGEHYSAVRRLLRENGYSMFMCGMFLARVT